MEILHKCRVCHGTKLLDMSDTVECNRCDVNGYVHWGKLEIDNIIHSYKILECLDATEHNALTDTQKDGVSQILSCGLVDLNDGKVGRVRLWNWFGAESTTVASLTALLT
jgi:hypothetical protein